MVVRRKVGVGDERQFVKHYVFIFISPPVPFLRMFRLLLPSTPTLVSGLGCLWVGRVFDLEGIFIIDL